jgi:hypothetical protein
MAKEQFLHPETASLFKQLEDLSQRSAMSRGQAFEDWLTAMTCAMAGGTMEDEYMAMVQRHTEGDQGRRGADLMPQMFGQLVNAMEETRADILGDLFQGAITYGEAGQFLTPEAVCQLMAKITSDDSRQDEIVCDPCCGSGRMLLAYAEMRRPKALVGQDVDLRCVKITAINLGLRNLYGYVLWGNSLAPECKLAYRTGFNIHGGVIRHAQPSELTEMLCTGDPPDDEPSDGVTIVPCTRQGNDTQLRMF